MKTAFSILLPLIAGLLVGCAAAPVTRTPPDAALRADLGKMVVVAISSTPSICLQAPEVKSYAAAACATELGFTPLLKYCHGGASNGGDPFTPAAVVGWIPVGLVIGGTYGAASGVTDKSLKEKFATLAAVVDGRSFENELSQHVCRIAAQQGWQISPQKIRNGFVGESGPIAAGQSTEMDYRPLHDRGISTVLEIKTYSPGLESHEAVNPPLHFAVDVRLRLIATSDGRQLYYDYLEYRSAKHSFTTWSADDARLFRAELDESLNCLSREIAQQIFTRATASEFVATANLHRK